MEARSYAYWEYSNSNRDYQSALFRELESRIDQCELMLCVLSEKWRDALQTSKPAFLLKAYDMRPTLMIADKIFIDFTLDKEDGFTRLGNEMDKFDL